MHRDAQCERPYMQSCPSQAIDSVWHADIAMWHADAAEKVGKQKGGDAVKEGMHVIKAAMEDFAGATYIHVSHILKCLSDSQVILCCIPVCYAPRCCRVPFSSSKPPTTMSATCIYIYIYIYTLCPYRLY